MGYFKFPGMTTINSNDPPTPAEIWRKIKLEIKILQDMLAAKIKNDNLNRQIL